MSDPVALALIAAVPGTLAAIFAGIAAIRGAENTRHIENLGKDVNGRMEDLLQHSHSTGRLAEQEEVRARAEKERNEDAARKRNPQEP